MPGMGPVIFGRSSGSTVWSRSLSVWLEPHWFLPAGESCNEVIVLAVRFQNWVSFANAPVGMIAILKAIRVVAGAILAAPEMLRRNTRCATAIEARCFIMLSIARRASAYDLP